MTEKVTTAMKSSQRMIVMRHLREKGTLTSLEALREYGIMQLPARISELRARGERIKKERVTAKNRYGVTVRIMQYSLITDDGDAQGEARKEKGGGGNE